MSPSPVFYARGTNYKGTCTPNFLELEYRTPIFKERKNGWKIERHCPGESYAHVKENFSSVTWTCITMIVRCVYDWLVDDFTFRRAQSEPIDDATVDVHVWDVQKAESWSQVPEHEVGEVGVPPTAGHVEWLQLGQSPCDRRDGMVGQKTPGNAEPSHSATEVMANVVNVPVADQRTVCFKDFQTIQVLGNVSNGSDWRKYRVIPIRVET